MIEKQEMTKTIEPGVGTKSVVGKATEKSGKPNRTNDFE